VVASVPATTEAGASRATITSPAWRSVRDRSARDQRRRVLHQLLIALPPSRLLNGEPVCDVVGPDPVAAMGATGSDVTTSGKDGVSQALKLVASRNSDCTDCVFDIIAARRHGVYRRVWTLYLIASRRCAQSRTFRV